MKVLLGEHGFWDEAEVRVAKVALSTVSMSQKEKNWATLRQFRDVPFDTFVPVEGGVPFHMDNDIMDNTRMRILHELPVGDYTFFPFEPIDQPCSP